MQDKMSKSVEDYNCENSNAIDIEKKIQNLDKSRLTIYVASPNSYADAFHVYYQCFKRFWKDCPYEFVLATNNQEYPDIRVINNYRSNDSWTERSLSALEQIKSKYVLLMCDDTFFVKNVDNKKIEEIIDIMDQYKINACHLDPCRKGKKMKGSDDLIYLNKRRPYALNLCKMIYNREFLLELLEDGTQSAWDLERKWVADTLNAPNEFYTDIVGCNKDLLATLHGISKGKWFPSTRKKLEKMGIEVVSERGFIGKWEERMMLLQSEVGKRLSPKMRRIVKGYLSKLGFQFVTDN